MNAACTEALAAQCRALKKQGARLSADRDRAFHAIESYEEGIERAVEHIQKLRIENERIRSELARCRTLRHRLLLKLAEWHKKRKEGGSSATLQPST